MTTADTAAIVAVVGVLGSSVAILGWVVKYVLRNFNATLSEYNKTHDSLSQNIAKYSDVADKQLALISKQLDIAKERDERDEAFYNGVLKNLKSIDGTVKANNRLLKGGRNDVQNHNKSK